MNRARITPGPVLAAGVLVFLGVLLFPIFLGTVYTEDDLGAFHLPLRDFYQHALADGTSFLWTPYLFNGFYLLGEGQLGMLHPLQALIYRVLPLETAFTLELWLSYPFALLGMALFLRRWKLPWSAAVFGGFCFAFIGFNLNHYVHLHFVAILAHLPWSLYAIDCTIRRPGARRPYWPLLLLFMLSLSQLLKAMPQAILFSWIAEAIYAAVLLAHAGVMAKRWRELMVAGALLFAVKLLAAGAAGAQLLPLWEGLQASYRANPSEDFRQSISLHPWNLIQFFNPYLFQRRVYAPFSGDEPWDAIYFGAAAPALLVLLLLRWRELGHARLLAGFGLGLAAFGLLAALGHYGFLYTLLDELPVLNQLRAPARYVALFHAGLAVALPVSIGCLIVSSKRLRFVDASCPPLKGEPEGPGMLRAGEEAEQKHARESTSPLIPLQRGTKPEEFPRLDDNVAAMHVIPGRAWCLLLPVLGAILSMMLPFVLAAHLVMPLSTAAFGAVLVGLGSVLVWASARGVRLAPVLLVLFILADAGLYGLRHKPTQTLESYLAEIPQPPAQAGARIDPDIHPTTMNRYGMIGYRVPYGYTALMPARSLDYTQEDALRIAGVEWREARETASPELAAAYARGETWVKLRNSLPRLRVVPEPDAMTFLAVTIVVEEETPGRLRVNLATQGAAWFFFGERWHSGWRATVDGAPAEIVPAHSDFMAVAVPGGDAHRVEFVFGPASYRDGKRISFASLSGSAIFFLVLGYRRLRGSRA